MVEQLGVDPKIVPKSKAGQEMLRNFMEEQARQQVQDEMAQEEDDSHDPKSRYFDAKYAEFAHVS